MNTGYELIFLKALALSITIETPVLFLLVRRFLTVTKERLSNVDLLFAGIVASSLTLPYVWFIVPALVSTRSGVVIVGESLAVIVETIFYRFYLRLGWKSSLILSLFCNMVSFSLGLYIL